MKKYIKVLFIHQNKSHTIKKSIQIHTFLLGHEDFVMCVYYSGHVRLFTSLLTKSYPDLAPNIPPDPPPDLGDEARPLRGIFTSSIKT